jgi:hypothetical protein
MFDVFIKAGYNTFKGKVTCQKNKKQQKRERRSKMEKAKLIEAVKALNTAVYMDEEKGEEVPILETKIKVVAVKEEVLKAAFVEVCGNLIEKIEAGEIPEEAIPEIAIDAYNTIAEEAEGEGKPEPEEKKTKVEKETKKEPKKSNLPDRPKDEFGRVKNSMSGRIDELLVKGATKEDVAKAIAEEFGRDEKKASAKVKSHMKTLKGEGYKITEKDGVYKLFKK